MGYGHFFEAARMRGNGLKLHWGRFRLDTSKNFFTEKVAQGLEQAAQGSPRGIIPGSIQKQVDVALVDRV